jgi:hypothetical protein
MKLAISALVSVMLLSACAQEKTNQQNGDMDSTAANAVAVRQNMVVKPNLHSEDGNDSFTIVEASHDMNEYLIPLTTAQNEITRFHKLWLKDLKHNIDSSNLSFMVDADMLRNYLTANPDIKKLDFYLAQKSDKRLNLVFTGAALVPGSETTYREVVYTKAGDSSTHYVMDRVLPCPTCDRDGIRSYIYGHVSE